jgi:S-ribosylhomocysteine lyase LuxS involved in autoinducer biosynthesis
MMRIFLTREPKVRVLLILEDVDTVFPHVDRISMKYPGTLDHPIAKMITDSSKKGDVVIIEISPKFFSTWDYSKMQL